MTYDLDRGDFLDDLFGSMGPLRSLVENARDIIFVVDRKQVIRYINHPAPGYQLEDILGVDLDEFVDPAFHKEVLQAIEQVFLTGDVGDIDVQGTGAYGSTVWYESRYSPIRNGDEVAGVAVVITDISQRKNTELSLRKEREFMHQCMDVIDAIVLALDAEGRITLINQPGADLIGRSKNDVMGLQWFDHFVPEDDRERAQAAFDLFMLNKAGPVEYFDNLVITAGNVPHMIAWHNSTLRDEKGNPVGTLSYGTVKD